MAGTQTEIRFALTSRTVSMWRLLGVIVHHEFVEVVRYQLQVKALIRATPEAFLGDMLDGAEKYYFQPKIFIKSDKSGLLIVDILEITDLFLERLLHPIVSVCENQGLYLEEDYLV